MQLPVLPITCCAPLPKRNQGESNGLERSVPAKRTHCLTGSSCFSVPPNFWDRRGTALDDRDQPRGAANRTMLRRFLSLRPTRWYLSTDMAESRL